MKQTDRRTDSNDPAAARRRGIAVLLLGGLLLSPLAAATRTSAAPGRTAPERLPLPEAKRLVRMMDDIYKTGVLTTHRMYVQEPGTAAAVTWAKQVARQVEERGWPPAHIFASHDRPLHPENSMKDAFERDAVAAFHQGKTVFERVEGDTLRYASDIRVTDKSCLACHVKNKEGDLLGGVSYRVPLTTSTARAR